MTSNELFEEILPLAPLQEGMLFHATYDEDALDVYTVRLAVDFEGPFDIATFREAVRALLVRRNNLRAGFLSENLSKPVQVIPREFETPVVVHDLSELAEDSRQSRLAELAAEEEAVRFDLANPPLLRFTVVRLAERDWRLMFSCHHILLDGWSMPLVLGELFELYQREGDASGLPDATPFKLYLAWLRKQDKEAALDAWRTALEGLPGPTKVAPEASDTVSALPGGTTVDLPEEQSAALTALARRLGVTVNTVVQVGWGLLLSRLTDRRDLVFGATVSGRPAEIEGVESIVGLFINTVPVRMRLDAAESLRELLIRVQDEQSALLDHHYVGLTDIQRAAGHNGLFDSMVAFESYPVDEGLKGSLGELTITGVSGSDATHYPLTLIVVPGDRLQLRLGFRQNLFTEETAGALLGGLEQLLARIATDDGAQAEEAAAAVELPEGWTVAAADSVAASGSSVSDLTAAPGGGRAARTPHEEVLCGLFAEALGVASVSIDDNFFDLGGHSLMATKLVSRIRSVFEIELPVRALFDAQTVAALAERVSGSVDDGRSAIQPMERPEQIPLSFAQRRLWFLNRMEGPGATYNIPLTVRLTGPLNHTALRHALRDILHRHETLRTTYPDHDGQPWQHITPTTHTTLPYTTQTTTETTLEDDLNTLATTGFDLTTQLPIRITLLQITPTDHILNLTIHHIATDGWSQAPLAQDLTTAYTAHNQGTTPNWQPLPVQYADYALWQHDTLGNENDPDSPITTQLPPRLHNDLQNLARTTRSSLFMVLQTGITGLLNKLGAGTDIPLGTAIAGRTDTALDNLIGFFINTLVLRTDASGDPTFRELLNRTRTTDLTAQPLNTQTGAAKFDLGFNFIEEKGEDGQPAGIEVTVEYATDLFDEETVERLTRRLGRLLSLAVADPEMPISQFDLLEPDEWQQLTAGGSGAQDAAGTDDEALDTVAGLFAEQAARTPARTAIVAADAHLTYAELDARSTRLATHLTAHGVQHGDTVAIAVPRSAAHTVAHLAVLRAGAVCLPLETDHPAGRIARLLDDTAPVAVLTTRNVHATLPETDAPVVVLDDAETAHELAVLPADPTAFPAPLPDSPAYLLHPSGSAGRPKGVLVPHRGIANRLRWMRDNHELGAEDRVLYKAPADLDVSVWELLSPLVAGAVQIVAEPGSHRDPARLAALIEHTEVTCLHFAPSLLREFLAEAGADTYAGLRRVFLSGEPLATVPADELRELLPHAEIHLLYGATEASFDSLARDARDAEGAYPAAGRLIRNTRAYVLDSQLSPMPTGSAGELYLGGAGLAHGYLGRPALTAERFVADPYGPAGSRLYRTGDLARITRVGTVELIGRTDDRITIGGRHVEPAEVERVLTLHRGVDVALVTTRPSPSGEVVLVAYHTPIDPDAPAEAEALRTYLAQELPDYTVPAHYVSLAAFPRLEDGGIDHAELPEPRREAVRPPRNDIEQTLCDLFSELLGKHVNNIDDSFFDLGGHSLLATKLVSRVRSTFSIELPFRDIFDAQTVAALAERVSGSVDDGRSAIQPMERPEQIPLSFAQRRLWFLNRMEGPGATYNIPLTVRLTGPLNHTALRHALRDILHRHETLRTTYPDHDGQPWQHITPTTHTTLPYTTQTTTETTLEDDLNTLATTGFDLTTQLPIRITLLQITPTDHILNLTIHHIATDGWSQAPLAQDLTTAYTAHNQGTTPNWQPLPVQYADYALWQHDTLGNENDPDSPITTQLPPRLHNDLQNLARTTRSSLFMVLQTGITGLLNKLGAGTDIPLGTAIAGRTDTALDNLIGFFINTLVLRTDASGDPTFRELLNRTRTTDLTAYNHQDLPFEQLVHALQP
ncbi:amino acid adenylation domain-containing protein, partial [Streptomyces sp. P38-E01]